MMSLVRTPWIACITALNLLYSPAIQAHAAVRSSIALRVGCSARTPERASWLLRDSTTPARTDTTVAPPIIGFVLPNFGFTDLDGQHHDIAEYRGKYVLIDVWGTWCHTCRAELEGLKKTYATYHPRGFEIVGLSFEEVFVKVKPEDQAAFDQARKTGAWTVLRTLPWPQTSTLVPNPRASEAVPDLLKRLDAHGYPYKILLDPRGRVIELRQDLLYGPELAATLDLVMTQD